MHEQRRPGGAPDFSGAVYDNHIVNHDYSTYVLDKPASRDCAVCAAHSTRYRARGDTPVTYRLTG